MKFDSYQRFIKSELYTNCLAAESKNLPLPYSERGFDQSLHAEIHPIEKVKTMTAPTKLKKSLSNAEDRRRKSLLPWHRKTRCKSKDRNEDKVDVDALRTMPIAVNIEYPDNDTYSSRSSLTTFDAAISSKSRDTLRNDLNIIPSETSLTRIILSDGATTIAQTRFNECVRDLVDRLLEKRGIFYQSYDAYVFGTNKPIDITTPSTCLAGKEVLIEKRISFKLDLPNKKVISVKSKPSKTLSDVLKPILYKYNYDSNLVKVRAS